MKKVVVIILNFKVKDRALACLRSVEKSSYRNLNIVMVDNGSEDGLAEEMKQFREVEFVSEGKKLCFIETGKNLGYTGGNNIGIKQALKMGAEYVFILNPDTEIEPSCIGKLIELIEKAGYGIAAPKIYFEDKKTIWYAGGILDLANVLGSHRGVDEIDKGQYDREGETDYATGAAMMIKNDVFQKIGFLNEKYFLYYEDSEFSFRAKRAGFKVGYVPAAIAYHANAKSTGLGSPLQDYYTTRNRMLFASQFLSFRTRFALIREALRSFAIPTRRMALGDFLSGRFGKGNI